MPAIGSIIETGVDKLVKLVRERSRISMEDAAKELGVSLTVIEEWSDFLEEEGIISLEYKFTKPFLVGRKLTKIEVETKAKEFKGKKEVFVRKAEGTLSFLEREAVKLKKVKAEFDKLKKEFGIEIDTIKSDVAELEKYQKLKTNLDQQIYVQRTETQKKIDGMAQKILREQKRYQEVLTEIKKEGEELKKEKQEALSIEESERLLKERLTSLKAMINEVEKKIIYEDSAIKNSEEHIEKLKTLTDLTKQKLEREKGTLTPLVKKSLEQEKKIQLMQDKILEGITKKGEKIKISKKASKKLKGFFDKKMQVVNLIEKVNKDRDSLENELMGLIKKAKSFQLVSKSSRTGKQMASLEKKFKEVDKKKNTFEREFKKLSILIKQ